MSTPDTMTREQARSLCLFMIGELPSDHPGVADARATLEAIANAPPVDGPAKLLAAYAKALLSPTGKPSAGGVPPVTQGQSILDIAADHGLDPAVLANAVAGLVARMAGQGPRYIDPPPKEPPPPRPVKIPGISRGITIREVGPAGPDNLPSRGASNERTDAPIVALLKQALEVVSACPDGWARGLVLLQTADGSFVSIGRDEYDLDDVAEAALSLMGKPSAEDNPTEDTVA